MTDKNESDAESEPLTPVENDSDQYFVYCVNEGYLPSHIRNVVLVTEQIYKEQENIELEKQTPCSCKNKNRKSVIISVVIFLSVCLISSVVALSVWKYYDYEQDKVLTEWQHSRHTTRNTSMATDNRLKHDEKTDTPSNRKDKDIYKESRSPCHKICYSYSAFKFASRCEDGFCTCSGHGYHPKTCLPKVQSCTMQNINNKFARSKFKQEQQKTFSCTTDTELNDEIHVISVFGNNYMDRTILNVTDSRNQEDRPITLVLSNYQKVQWVVNIKDKINVKKVYLISNKNLRNSHVTVINSFSESTTNVIKVYSQMGYGDDRYGGHTVQLLEKINKDIGQITTFTGTSQSDHWSLTLTNHYSLETEL